MLEFAEKNSKRVFEAVYDDLERQLQRGFDALPEELEYISCFLTKSLRRYLCLAVDKALGSTEFSIKSAAIAKEKLRLEKSVISVVAEWAEEWRSPILDVNNNQIDCIPEKYKHAQTELEEMEGDNDYLESDSDSDTASNPDIDADDLELKAILGGDVGQETKTEG